MKPFFLIYIFCVSVISNAQVPSKPAQNSFIYDYAETFTDSQRISLQKILYDFELVTDVQLVIINVENLNGLIIEDYTIQIAEEWGVGNAGDKGVLICNSISDRQTRIEVGYGLEHIITDYWSSKHIREDAATYFKKGDYFLGIYTLVESLINKINPEYNFIPIKAEILSELKEGLADKIPEKPTPFVHIINATDQNISDSLQILEAQLSKIKIYYDLPIHFLIVNNNSITEDNIIDFSYEVRENWGFPRIIEEENLSDGVLIVYNIQNNVSTDIAGFGYKDNLRNTYQLLDSTLIQNNKNLHDKIKYCADTYAEYYKDEQWSFYYLVLGIIGFVVLLMLISYFFRNAKVSAGNNKRKRTRYIDTEDNSTSESESYESSFGGGRFGGGGATGSW